MEGRIFSSEMKNYLDDNKFTLEEKGREKTMNPKEIRMVKIEED